MSMSVQLPQESGPLWTALVEILNAERAEKDRLKQDIELLSTELERARQLHLSTYKELQNAESTMSQMMYPVPPGTVVRTPKQVLERGGSTPKAGTETMRSDGRVTYDKSLKLQSTGTPVIGTLTTPKVKEDGLSTSAKKVRFRPVGLASYFQSPERRNLSQTLASSASPSTVAKTSSSIDYLTPTKSKASTSQELVPSSMGVKTPSNELIEFKWKERCLTAEYKQKMLEQQVSELETDVITMSLKLEDKLDLQDKLLVKKFEIKSIDKWQRYILRKCLLLVRVLSRQVAEAMAAMPKTTGILDWKQKVQGWKLVLQDMNLVTKSINGAGIRIKNEKGDKRYEFDLDAKEVEAAFQRFDSDGDGLITLKEFKEMVESLRAAANKRPMTLPAPVPLTVPPADEDTGIRLGDFYKELMSKHKKIKHFGKRIDINVQNLNKLNAKLLKAVYFTYSSFGMGHGEERTQHANIMDGNNFAKLCRECGIISALPLAEADIFFAAVTEIYSRNLTFHEFLHALLMVSEESSQDLERVITQVIDHGVPEIHVRTKKPMPPILKTASRPEIWQRKKADEE